MTLQGFYLRSTSWVARKVGTIAPWERRFIEEAVKNPPSLAWQCYRAWDADVPTVVTFVKQRNFRALNQYLVECRKRKEEN